MCLLYSIRISPSNLSVILATIWHVNNGQRNIMDGCVVAPLSIGVLIDSKFNGNVKLCVVSQITSRRYQSDQKNDVSKRFFTKEIKLIGAIFKCSIF